jgi:hypothetical protein
MRYAILLVLLSGCSLGQTVPAVVPYITLEFCDEVQYQRRGLDIAIQAKCRAPVR